MASPEQALPEQIGRYRIVRLLGQGAMGRVLLAHDPVLDRDVALKLLRSDLGVPPDQERALVERMRQEARASARVSHPNIVALHDMGEDPALGLYLVFEYLDGVTLKDKLTRGALGPQAAAKLAREIGDALTTAHTAGVLHRDIKPENVILTRTGGKVADFGIARVPNSTLTKNGRLLGTPAYSAPEAIAHGTFSAQSDQFSMAATLWEGVSGRRAFPGDDAMTVATRISTENPPPIAELCGLDPHVDTVFARALSKTPSARFASCEEFGRALSEALDLAPRTAMPTLPDGYHRAELKQTKGRGPGFALGGAVVGAAVAVLGFQLMSRHRAHTAIATNAPGTDGDAGVQEAAAPAVVKEHPHHHHAHHRHRSTTTTPGDGGSDAPTDATREARPGAPDGAASVTAKTDAGRDAGTRSKSDLEWRP